jgi:hypothetical protein
VADTKGVARSVPGQRTDGPIEPLYLHRKPSRILMRGCPGVGEAWLGAVRGSSEKMSPIRRIEAPLEANPFRSPCRLIPWSRTMSGFSNQSTTVETPANVIR